MNNNVRVLLLKAGEGLGRVTSYMIKNDCIYFSTMNALELNINDNIPLNTMIIRGELKRLFTFESSIKESNFSTIIIDNLYIKEFDELESFMKLVDETPNITWILGIQLNAEGKLSDFNKALIKRYLF